ncbi:uncharacterized protein BYT42DRAFT_616242 [Radiomyces spectabilis]|uniref:uncharacterized protein n=1 Tax=Radiomyces spectabilis TaxID=64574 RepID=UPI00221E91EF|nr:uncharacterized protein BYT42DRAFT_616242 [Radiomyces spectabilis]KAI8373059.1 hypothetical protein BYT42DRAFT_616242 [Radiomyces spectabilis]
MENNCPNTLDKLWRNPDTKLARSAMQVLEQRKPHAHRGSSTAPPLQSLQASQLPHRPSKPSREPTPLAESTAKHAITKSNQEVLKSQRKMFQNCVFYLDAIEEPVAGRLNRQIAILGARTETFFSAKCTHIVTSRPFVKPKQKQADSDDHGKSVDQENAVPTHDQASDKKLYPLRTFSNKMNTAASSKPAVVNHGILEKAFSMKMTVWSVEKMLSILQRLLERPNYRTERAKQGGLDKLLQEEKMYGISTSLGGADGKSAPKPQFIPFRKHYMKVDDATGVYRTLVAKEYLHPREDPHGLAVYPILRNNKPGISPFTRVLPKDREEKKPNVKAKDTAVPQPIKVAAKPNPPNDENKSPAEGDDPMEIDTLPKDTMAAEHVHATRAEMPCTPNQTPDTRAMRSRAASITRTPSYERTKGDTPGVLTPDHSQPSPSLRPSGFQPSMTGLQPSGFIPTMTSRQLTTSAINPKYQRPMDENVSRLDRRMVDGGAGPIRGPNNQLPSLRTMTLAKTVQGSTQQPSSQKEESAKSPASQPKRQPLGAISEKEAKQRALRKEYEKRAHYLRDMDMRYCENCQVRFEDLEKHEKEEKHQAYIRDETHFKDLDTLMAEVRRPYHSPLPAHMKGIISRNIDGDNVQFESTMVRKRQRVKVEEYNGYDVAMTGIITNKHLPGL